MNENIVTALISLFSTALGTLGGICVTNKLTAYRLTKLEEKVDKHNNLIERMYKVEEDVQLLNEKQKVANHRIDDLENK